MSDTLYRLGSPKSDEVLKIQQALHSKGYNVGTPDGIFGRMTDAAIRAYQKDNNLVVDGIVGPRTFSALIESADTTKYLHEDDVEKAAAKLGVSVAHIKTISEVESRGSGFTRDGNIALLFERHHMYRSLRRIVGVDEAEVLAIRHPDLVNSRPGGYLRAAAEYERFLRAKKLHEEAALLSASYGRYQIMGFNFKALGYESVNAMFDAFYESEGNQLDGLVRFIMADKLLHKALQENDWATVARRYNGPNYHINQYDTKLEEAYGRFSQVA